MELTYHLLNSSRRSLLVLLFLSFVYFLENFDRYLISVSPIPYIDYNSYEYSVLAGPAFTIIYTFGGLVIALGYDDDVLTTATHNKSIVFSKFNILMIATLVFSLSFASTALASYFWQQLLIRLAMGLSQSIVTPFSTSIISDHFPSSVRGSAFGIFNSGTYFAFSLSLSLGTYIYVNYGWKSGYLLFGLIGISVSICIPCLSCYDYYTKNKTKVVIIQDDSTNGYTHTLLKRDSEGHVYNLVDTTHQNFNAAEDGVTTSPQINPLMGTTVRRSCSDNNQLADSAYHVSNGDGSISTDNTQKGFSSITKSTSSSTWQISNKIYSTWHAKWIKGTTILRDIVFIHWGSHPGVYLLCIASGIRIGAGYVWSSYTSVFFSDLFSQQLDSTCDYSYNADVVGIMDGRIDICGDQYPYCVSGSCNKLTANPWHNEGMKSLYLEEYMAWVPVVGSAFGSLLGGFLSDLMLQRIHGSQSSSRIDTVGDANNNDDNCDGNAVGVEDDDDDDDGVNQRSDSPSRSRPYAMLIGLEGDSSHSCRGGGDINKLSRRLSNNEQSSISGPPANHLIGEENTIDDVSDGISSSPPQAMRMLITVCSNLLALPLIVYALQLDFPHCFLILIASGMVGELYLIQCLALLTHREVIPEALITPSIALFMFVITIIGGNAPLLVTLFTSIVGYDSPVQLSFEAQSQYTGDPTVGPTSVRFTVDHADSRKLQYAMTYVLGGCYGLSAVLYLMSYRQMSRSHSSSSS